MISLQLLQVSFQNQIWQMIKICVSDIDGRLGNNTRLWYIGEKTRIYVESRTRVHTTRKEKENQKGFSVGVWVYRDHVNRRDHIYPRLGRHAHGRYSREKTKIKKIPPWLKDEKEEGSALGTEKLARSAAPPHRRVHPEAF